MDFIEFSQLVQHDNLERNMKDHFDVHVAMFHIITHHRIGTVIYACEDSDKHLVYTIVPLLGCDIDNIIKFLNVTTIRTYGITLFISAIYNGESNTITLKLSENSLA